MTDTRQNSTKYFETRLAHDSRREKLWQHLTSYLSRFVPAGASVLELGAGYCYFINNVPAGRRVAVDLSEEIVHWKARDVEAHVGDAVSYLRTTEADQFDFILASNFFEHFEWTQLDEMLSHIRRLLRPGGALAAIQPNFRIAPRRYFDDYTHRTIFTDVSLTDWLTTRGLRVVHCEPRFLPLTVKSRFGGLSFLVPLYLASPIRPLAGQMFVLARKDEET